jgi:hypothetical protein
MCDEPRMNARERLYRSVATLELEQLKLTGAPFGKPLNEFVVTNHQTGKNCELGKRYTVACTNCSPHRPARPSVRPVKYRSDACSGERMVTIENPRLLKREVSSSGWKRESHGSPASVDLAAAVATASASTPVNDCWGKIQLRTRDNALGSSPRALIFRRSLDRIVAN